MTSYDVLTLTDAVIAQLAAELLSALPADRRACVGIAGIPGSGKSTLAQKLCAAACAAKPGVAVVVPMDGFHLPNAELDRLGLRQRKGAAETFDARAYLDLLSRARDCRVTLHFPVYDRSLHEPVYRETAEQRIGPVVRLIITEGNYLLLDDEPWRTLAPVLDACWWLQTDQEQARQWILARHVRGGRSPQDALDHFERSDRLNMERVCRCRRRPDRTLTWGASP